MKPYAAWVCLGALAAPAADYDLSRTLKGIEDRYNGPRTMQLLFEQTYTGHGGPPRTESGELFLRKPRRMRWQYRVPDGKLFLSDGRHVYFYSPSANRVEKMKLKESDDMRVPLAFLIGRIDFRRDFKEFRTRPQGQQLRIAALPKSERSPYTRVEFFVAPSYQIRRLVVHGQDESVMEFNFSQESLNPPLDGTLFEFRMPPGAELVEMTDNDSGANY